MSDQADKQQAPDLMQLWREWLTQSERQFNAFFNEAMSSEPFARSVGSYMETFAAVQRMLAQGMERYLALMNLPSRTDVVSLGETLRSLEERLARIEEILLIAIGASEGREARPLAEPARTRRPPGVPPAVPSYDAVPAQEPAIPQELRR